MNKKQLLTEKKSWKILARLRHHAGNNWRAETFSGRGNVRLYMREKAYDLIKEA